MKHYRKFKIAIWTLTIIWMGVIFYFSHQPADISKEESGRILVRMELATEEELSAVGDRRIFLLQYYIRKTAHVTVFLVLGSLLTLSVYSKRLNGFKAYLTAYISGTLYGVSDEIHQMFVPGRGPLVRDVMLDSFGALIGVVITASLIELILHTRSKRNNIYKIGFISSDSGKDEKQ